MISGPPCGFGTPVVASGPSSDFWTPLCLLDPLVVSVPLLWLWDKAGAGSPGCRVSPPPELQVPQWLWDSSGGFGAPLAPVPAVGPPVAAKPGGGAQPPALLPACPNLN